MKPLFENKFCKIVLKETFYVLMSKSGKYNNQYFLNLQDAKKSIGILF